MKLSILIPASRATIPTRIAHSGSIKAVEARTGLAFVTLGHQAGAWLIIAHSGYQAVQKTSFVFPDRLGNPAWFFERLAGQRQRPNSLLDGRVRETGVIRQQRGDGGWRVRF